MGESWIKKDGPEGDIVLGTRIRLARNFAEIPFPAVANREQARQVLQQAKQFPSSLRQLTNVKFYELAEVEELERQILMENT